MHPALALLDSDDLARAVSARAGAPLDEVRPRLADVASEARLALALIDRPPFGPVPAGARVLEVGAGTGVVAAVLAGRGLAVTALEPLIAGFDVFGAIRAELEARLPAGTMPPLDGRPAAALDPARDGTFDRIFSINVLEHCQPLDATLDALARVLAPGGVMVHTCPNYRVPYEPHYAMPLVPLAPRLTARLRPGLAEDPLWQSLNFVTAGDVRRAARRHGLSVSFAPGVLADVVTRLAADPAFARRQGWAGRVAAGLARAGALEVLARLPGSWLTPMVAVIERPAR